VAQKPEIAEATDAQRRFAFWKRKALSRPVVIRNHGQDEIVMLSAEEYARLKRRDREVLRAEDFSDEDLKAIAKAEVPREFAHLDAELNRKPRSR
jgi:PHD/YefM family antitoxin component YafN of YafNO toxin-antitoxin module